MINPKPMTTYTAPALPTLAEVSGNTQLHDLKKQMPLRWRKSAAVLACVGVMGGSMFFTGCSETNPTTSGGGTTAAASPTDPTASPTDPTPYEIVPHVYTKEDLILEVQMHGGGANSSPFYVVYFTEQEAFGIIRSQLEQAGLRFDATPPGYTVDWSGTGGGFRSYEETINLGLFDSERNVAISNPRRYWDNEEVVESFEKQNSDITFGVLSNPKNLTALDANNWQEDENGEWHRIEPTEEEIRNEKDRLRPELEEQLTAQVQDFIKLLQEKGILET